MNKILFLTLLGATSIWALPEELAVISGEAAIHATPQRLELTVSDRAILEWNRFSISAGETVRFIQPSAQAAVLNRVVGSNLSEIYGTLQANGAVYLINPRGIIIGETGLIDTASFLALTVDIPNAQFLNGKEIQGAPLLDLRRNEPVSLVQEGGKLILSGGALIRAEQSVQLIAREVEIANGASIEADGIGDSNGGKIIVWADEKASVHGKASARGGPLGGDGGFVEVSSNGSLDCTGFVADRTAPLGKPGTLLFDPINILISADPSSSNVTFSSPNYQGTGGTPCAPTPAIINTSDIETNLALGNVTISTNATNWNSCTDGGIITVSDPITWSAATELTLIASSNISITAPITNTNAGGGFSCIDFTANGISSGTASGIELSSGGALSTVSGHIALEGTASGSSSANVNGIYINSGSINSGGGNITLVGNVSGGTGQSNGILIATANGITSDTGTITLTGTTSSTGSNSRGVASIASWAPTTTNLTHFLNCTGGFGTANHGVDIEENLIASGPISFTATAGSGANSYGVNLNAPVIASGAIIFSSAAGMGTGSFANHLNSSVTSTASTITATGATLLSGSLTTTGQQIHFINDVTLGGTSSIASSGGAILFDAMIDGAQALTLNSGAANITLAGDVGMVTPLASFTATGNTIFQNLTLNTTGAIQLTASTIDIDNDITTNGGSVTFTGPVSISADPMIDTTNNGASSGGNVTFSTTLNGATSLTFATGTNGTISFNGEIGNSSEPTNLIFNSAKQIRIAADITVSGVNPLNLSQPIFLTGDSTITTNNRLLTFGSTIDGAQVLTIASGTANVAFNGATGGTTPPTNLVFSSAHLINVANDIAVSGANPLTFPVPFLLVGDSTINSNGAAITFSSTLRGMDSYSLTLTAGAGQINFLSTVGSGGLPVASLTASGSSIHVSNNVITGGSSLHFLSPVVLENNITFTDNGSGMTFDSTISGLSRTLVLVAPAGQITINGATTVLSLTATTLFGNGTFAAITAPNGVTITSSNGNVAVGTIVTGSGSIALQPSATEIPNLLSPGDLMPQGFLSLNGDLTASGSVTLSGLGRTTLLSAATIGANQNLTITADTLTLGHYETLTAMGNITFAITGAAQFGDLIATGQINISSGSNEIFLHGTHAIYDSFGALYPDMKTNILATGSVPAISSPITYTALDAGAPSANIYINPFSPNLLPNLLFYSGYFLTMDPDNLPQPPFSAQPGFNRSMAESFQIWNDRHFGPYLSDDSWTPLLTSKNLNQILPSLFIPKRMEPEKSPEEEPVKPYFKSRWWKGLF